MINNERVFKIKIISKSEFWGETAWALGTNVCKRGGSGKTWTSEKLAIKNFDEMQGNRLKSIFKGDYILELVTFKLTEE